MAQHTNSRDRGWRNNHRQSYPPQQDAYQDEFNSSAPGRRHARHDQMPPYERDNDHRMPEGNTWEQVNHTMHGNFPVDAGRPPRNDLGGGGQPAPGRFPFTERGPQNNWRAQEPTQIHFNDRGFVREDTRPIHPHSKNSRGPAVDMPQQWRGPQQEPQLDWRERELPPDFDRGRVGRQMDWEPAFQNPGWNESHGNPSVPPFGQHHPSHQEPWSHQNEWQEGPPHWSHQLQSRLSYDRPSFQQQNRRQHPYHRPHQSDNQNYNRSGQWDRSGPNHRVHNHSSTADSKDQRINDSPTKPSYQRKPEKRRHSRSRSVDSTHERRRSQSPKRRRRDSPPSSRAVYNRRSRSHESRHSTDKHNDRTSGKYRKDDDVNHRSNVHSRDKQSNYKKEKHEEDERDRYQKHDRGKQKKYENDRRQRSRSPSRSRSRTPRSRSRSASRSSGHSRVRRRRENAPTRQRSPSRSRSRSASPQPSVSSKMKSSKHRLPVKTAPKIPLLEDVPLATSRAVLVTPTRSEPRPPQNNTNSLQKADGAPIWRTKGLPEPPKGPRGVKYIKDPSGQQTGPASFNQFFPDAPLRPKESADAIPTLAPVPTSQNSLSLLDRIGDVKSKKPKAKMVPIGDTPAESSTITVRSTAVSDAQLGEGDTISRSIEGMVDNTEEKSRRNKKRATTAEAFPSNARPGSPIKDEAATPRASETLVSASSATPISAVPVIVTTSALEDSTAIPTQATPKPRKSDELYKILTQVGEGTFGKVYKARNQVSGLHVALKRIRMEGEKDGFPVTAMREIKLLQSLKHENVVQLHEMMVSKGLVYMVFEYVHHDLVGVLQQTQFNLLPEHLKALSQQMLRGLAYLHLKGIIHRDLKASNILVNSDGQLKLADFGLARFYHKRHKADYTNRVITLWYRPPELLFGATVYGPEVDIWSAGCIFLELFVKKPTFQGNDEIHQLEVIFRILGTPTEERWPNLSGLPWYEIVKPANAMENVFQQSFKRWLSPDALDIAEKMLTFDPKQRITATDALQESYFINSEPSPVSPDLSTLEGEWHELEAKRMKKKRKAEAESETVEMMQP